LAPRFQHRLFLSATPHNGHSNNFSALLELLDRQRFYRGVKVTKKLRDEVIVRRGAIDAAEIRCSFLKKAVCGPRARSVVPRPQPPAAL
jgi:hypothetical protein